MLNYEVGGTPLIIEDWTYKINEKNKIHRIQDDLTMVYNETVMNIKDQLDRPISKAEIILLDNH